MEGGTSFAITDVLYKSLLAKPLLIALLVRLSGQNIVSTVASLL